MDLSSPVEPWQLLLRMNRYRRPAAAVLAGVAVVCALSALRPTVPATVPVWSAARDLSGGAALGAQDLRVDRLPTRDVPAGALPADHPIIGRMLAAPVRRGEPLTDVRLLSTALLASLGETGLVAVPVRVADGPATSALVQPGDRVDILGAAEPQSGTAAVTSTVARDVRVLAMPATDTASSEDSSSDSGGLLVVAATPPQAETLAQASGNARLSVAVQGGAG